MFQERKTIHKEQNTPHSIPLFNEQFRFLAGSIITGVKRRAPITMKTNSNRIIPKYFCKDVVRYKRFLGGFW